MPASDPVDIATACSRRGTLGVVGVVVDKLDMYRTKGSSSCITFTIKDQDLNGPSWHGGLKVKYFNDDPSVLPEVRLNDVVILRDIRVTMFQNQPRGVASQNDEVPWAILRPTPDPTSVPSFISGPGPFGLEPRPLEKRSAETLLDRIAADVQSTSPKSARRARGPQQPSQVVQASAPSPKQGGLPICLIENVQSRQLVQLLGQVVRLNTYDSEKTILYVTDYTTNTSLMDFKKDDDDLGTDGDQFGYIPRRKKIWPGPWGQLTIQVTLWEPHAGFARENVREGDLVHLTYVRIKDGPRAGIEASVHEDRRYPKKIHVRVVSPGYSEHAQELMNRRQAYLKIHGKPSDGPKKAEKKRKKNEQKQKENRIEEGQKTLPAPSAQIKKNPRIKTREYGQIAIRSVEKVLSGEFHTISIGGGISYTLPFQNVCYRMLVRVVDYFPPDLADFAVEAPMKSIIDRGDDEMDDGATGPRTEWQWRFCLLVEGTEPSVSKQQPRGLMKVYVTGAEGEHLLNMTATDLRRHQDTLEELKEKMWILWGSLQEEKEKTTTASDKRQDWKPPKNSSLPFECCIKEYGVRCSHPTDADAMVVDDYEPPCSQPDCLGWERRFAMFGTTIHSG